MLLPQLAPFSDVALLLLRFLIAAIFASSGWSHLTQPSERGESIGLSTPATALLGLAEVTGAASVALGIYAQVGAVLLIGAMVGAIYKKIFVWELGFWGEESQGWYYDSLYLVCNLVILTTGGGALVLVG